MSGQAPFVFTQREDLTKLPSAAQEFEVNLHGGFGVDTRSGYGQIYYGMPGCGIMRIDADLQKQEIINLSDELTPLNFHSTKIGEFDGKQRLFLPSNNDEMVVVLNLEPDSEVHEFVEGLARRRNMMRIMASLMKARVVAARAS